MDEWQPETLERALDLIGWLREELRATRRLYTALAHEADKCPYCTQWLAEQLKVLGDHLHETNDAAARQF